MSRNAEASEDSASQRTGKNLMDAPPASPPVRNNSLQIMLAVLLFLGAANAILTFVCFNRVDELAKQKKQPDTSLDGMKQLLEQTARNPGTPGKSEAGKLEGLAFETLTVLSLPGSNDDEAIANASALLVRLLAENTSVKVLQAESGKPKDRKELIAAGKQIGAQAIATMQLSLDRFMNQIVELELIDTASAATLWGDSIKLSGKTSDAKGRKEMNETLTGLVREVKARARTASK